VSGRFPAKDSSEYRLLAGIECVSTCWADKEPARQSETTSGAIRRMNSPSTIDRELYPICPWGRYSEGLLSAAPLGISPRGSGRRGDSRIGAAVDIGAHVSVEESEIRVFDAGSRELNDQVGCRRNRNLSKDQI